jgi:hypothetical protein
VIWVDYRDLLNEPFLSNPLFKIKVQILLIRQSYREQRYCLNWDLWDSGDDWDK